MGALKCAKRGKVDSGVYAKQWAPWKIYGKQQLKSINIYVMNRKKVCKGTSTKEQHRGSRC